MNCGVNMFEVCRSPCASIPCISFPKSLFLGNAGSAPRSHGLQKQTRPKPKIWLFSMQTESSCSKDPDPSKRLNVRRKLRRMFTAPEPIRTLLLDNYDSYTYNLYQLLSVVNGVAPIVLRNDAIKWDALRRLLYAERYFHNVVISPGPGSPTCASDVGICMPLLQECHDIPILGVCLGHQALACVHGAQILHAPEPVHGRLSEIEHNGHPLYASIPSGINSGFKVVRYHSLMVNGATLPQALVPTAWTVVERGFLAPGEWHTGIGTTGTNCLSEGQLLWHGRDNHSFTSRFPRWGSDSQLRLEGFNGAIANECGAKVLMGLSHRSWPHHGVQFHPESVSTTYGKQILQNFRNITLKFWEEQLWQPLKMGSKLVLSNPVDNLTSSGPRSERQVTSRRTVSLLPVYPSLCHEGKVGALSNHLLSHSAAEEEQKVGLEQKKKRHAFEVGPELINPLVSSGEPVKEREYLRLRWQKLPGLAKRAGGSRNLFWKLFGEKTLENTFWLDSSTQEQGGAQFSFMGGRGGSLWQQITYRIGHKCVGGTTAGVVRVQNAMGQVKETVLQDGFLDLLDRELELRRCRAEDYTNLPFDFCGGFIGYLGYELKIECGALSNRHRSPIPDAGMFLTDQLVVVDHTNDDIYVLALFQDCGIPLCGCETHIPGDRGISSSSWDNCSKDRQGRLAKEEGRCGKRAAEAWVEETVRKVECLGQNDLPKAAERIQHMGKSLQTTEENLHPPFVAQKSRSTYVQDVKRCQQFIRDGESYEVCLTTQLYRQAPKLDCFQLYVTLREMNPAPYSALLHFGKDGPCICSSSPERFLRLDRRGIVEAKPIKGTRARGNTSVEDDRLKYELQHSEKDQAENLMIVDLLRNDLGRVCEPGSVHVPSLMFVESYSTVHTLVSTVRGRKRQDATAVDCVRAAFPGGSMTGAPKLRTMEIIDSLESSPRGIYSGSLGYFSFNSCFDLNIVIRTLVLHEDEMSLGAGGAVTALSDPDGEYEEMLLKTKAPVRALGKYENDSSLAAILDGRG